MDQPIDMQLSSKHELDIIVADDARAQRWLLYELLHAAGHHIRVATNGKQAFQIAVESPPDLLITDLEMPGGDGFDLILSIRNSNDARLRKIPVIVCSSRNERCSLIRAFDLGATSFVTKPLHQSELQMAISNLQTT